MRIISIYIDHSSWARWYIIAEKLCLFSGKEIRHHVVCWDECLYPFRPLTGYILFNEVVYITAL